MTTWRDAVVVVAGGTGQVGEGIVARFLEEGAHVFVPSRSETKLERLRSRMPREAKGTLTTFVADLGDERGRDRILERLHEAPRVVVSSLGGFWQGLPLVELSEQEFRGVLEAGVFAHATIARLLLPRMKPEGAFVMINGAAALFPIARSAPLSISASAQLMLTRTLIAESSKPGPRVCGLVIGNLVRARDLEAAADALGSRQVEQAVLELAGGAAPVIRKLERSGEGTQLHDL